MANHRISRDKMGRFASSKVPRSAKKWFEEYKHPYVRKIMVTKESIIVYTKQLPLHHQGVVYKVNAGQFEIPLFPKTPQERTVAGWIRFHGIRHPHVIGQWACFGNITYPVNEMWRQKKFGVMISLIIRYLQACNPADRNSEMPWRDFGGGWALFKGKIY